MRKYWTYKIKCDQQLFSLILEKYTIYQIKAILKVFNEAVQQIVKRFLQTMTCLPE